MKQIEKIFKLAKKNSPVVLSSIAVCGVVATGIYAANGTTKALKILERESKKKDLTAFEKVKHTYKCYIPAFVFGSITIAAIISSNKVSSRRSVAIVSLYKISSDNFEKYRGKVTEILGKKREEEVRDAVMEERVNKTYGKEVIVTNGETLFYDSYSDRYFKSTVEEIRNIESEINREIINHDYASLNDLYDMVGLKLIPVGDVAGWDVDNRLKIRFSAVLTSDNKPCICLEYDIIYLEV